MTCRINSRQCKGPIYRRIFVWYRNNTLQNLSCSLCNIHYRVLLDQNYGIVPETTGSTIAAAIQKLLEPVEEWEEERIVYCTMCLDESVVRCNTCNRPLCIRCALRKAPCCALDGRN